MAIGNIWNDKFSRDDYLYGKTVNTFLARYIDQMALGSSLLLLGEGEGRNACYAASAGLNVTALDASEIGLAKARQLAHEQGVHFKTVLADLQEWEPNGTYNAIMTSFLHLKEPLRTRAFHIALRSLNSGGQFIGEFFSTEQLSRSSGGPKDIDLLYTVESLRSIFDREGCKIVMLEKVTDILNEGSGHQGQAELIRVVVEKH